MESDSLRNPNGLPNQKEGSPRIENSKPKIVVIMGATGSGKSRLAIDLASQFPIEIINADSMQVYQGLDVLTNKVPLHDQRGVPHHLLGTISPMVEFTAKNFRDNAIPLINDIASRDHLPVIVGGTNYYIQALVSHFLLDDSLEDTDESCLGDKQQHVELLPEQENFSYSHDSLKDIDPVAANRIHPNDHRKISQYLQLYACSGVLPSKYLQEKTMEKWANADNLRYNCCFICVDAALPVIDKYVEQRVDEMVDSGLLGEVYDIFNPDADYTRGLRQAIGVREFECFLKAYLSEDGIADQVGDVEKLKENMNSILSSSGENLLKQLLQEAIDKVKLNTRRLVRRQKRRVVRLQTLFGWNIHYVDATECVASFSEESWNRNVVDPSTQMIKCYFEKNSNTCLVSESGWKLIDRDLWTQHICKACGNKVLRGAHEWEQHKQGRAHRKRLCRLRKSG